MSLATAATENDLTSAAWIFEQIYLSEGQHLDRSRIRRSVDESAESYFDANPDSWCRWIVEAGQGLGRTSRVIDAELDELISLAADGIVVIVRSPDGQRWHAFTSNRVRSMRLLTPLGAKPVRVVSKARLKRILKQDGFDGVLRCVAVEPASFSATGATHTETGQTPLGRVVTLLRAEKTDIWVVLSFAVVSGLLSITTPLAVEALVNTVAFGRFLQPIVVLSLMLLAFLMFQAALKGLQTFVVEIIQRRLFARVAADLSFRLPRTTIHAYHEYYPPELVNRFFDIVTVQKTVSQLLMDGLSVVLSAVVGMTVLAFYHPYLLAFDVVLILLLLFTMFVLGRGAVKTSIKESKTKYAMAAWLEDLARCRHSFRYDGGPEFALERSNHLIYDYLSARRKHFVILMRQIIFMLVLQALASTALLGIGGWLVIAGELSLGQLVAAELIVALVVGSFAKLGKHIESFYDLLASIDKLGMLLDLPMERTDGLLALPKTCNISADRVCVSDPEVEAGLTDLSFSILHGDHTVLRGASVADTSLLLDALFGMRELDSGVLTIGGTDPGDLRPDVLRHRVALVRDVELFQGSIAEIVHMARPNISVAEVRAALELVGLLPTVLHLPDGMNTQITAHGSPLTVTEQRCLMVAQALAGHPDFVLIDGILDALPDEMAENLLQRITAPSCSWTVVLASQRQRLRDLLPHQIELKGTGRSHD